MIQSRMVKVDLTMAELFLSLEKEPEPGVEDTNRKFSPDVVNDYAVDMLRGDWRETHQGMAFTGLLKDNTAVFVDGGQRCRAIKQAATVGAQGYDRFYDPQPDIAINFMVSEALTQADVEAMDIGKRRTPGDIVQMAGWSNKNVVASAARLCILYENVPWSPEAWRKYHVSPNMIKEYLKDNPGMRTAVLEGSRLYKHLIPSSGAAGYHEAVKSGVEEKLLEEFMEQMTSGVGLDAGSPVLALRDMLVRTTQKKRKWNREEQMALFIKTLLKWLEGAEVKYMSFKTGGEHPDKFPRFTN